VTYTLHNGDCLDMLPTLPEADAIVTDPPSGIGFMGAEWDSDKGGRDAWVAWLGARLRAARLRPGGYALVWALPRTSHWTACAIEDAGLVIQDRLAHIFGSGFPKHKSHLKPAIEDWWLAYKPGGARALNVEGCRVEGIKDIPASPRRAPQNQTYGDLSRDPGTGSGWDASVGRWPPHLLLTHSEACGAACAPDCPVQILGEQSGERASGGKAGKVYETGTPATPGWGNIGKGGSGICISNTGTAARFFPQFRYAAKASRRERNEGLEGMPEQVLRQYEGAPLNNPDHLSSDGHRRSGERPPRANHHPTVKNLALMRWLVRLVTPAGGLVLDPFAGSGSTGCAAVLEGMRFQGVEMDATYAEIARARIAHYADPLRHMEPS
jgi:DNA modification methylase